jgi:elongator complex protein 3
MEQRARYTFDPRRHEADLLAILRQVAAEAELDDRRLDRILRRHPKDGRGFFSKSELLRGLRHLSLRLPAHELGFDEAALAERLRKKPVRTLSGVAPVTVLTRPHPCPGRCVFCPSDVRMPKSYLSAEPGAQRAAFHRFDPYLQTLGRLRALDLTGHRGDKVELLVLGGTWSAYPEPYQIWFVRRCLDALQDFRPAADGRGTPLPEPAVEPLDFHALPPRLPGPEVAVAADRGRYPAAPGARSEEPKRTATPRAQRVSAATLQPDPHLSGSPTAARRARPLRRTESETREPPTAPTAHGSYNEIVGAFLHRAQGGLARPEETASWEDLAAAQRGNETAGARCVGLVVETRPDRVTAEEVLRLRRLGVTKVQIGIQSLSDAVLEANRRGHDVAASRRAVALLRRAGFKIQAHWMANLAGSTPEADVEDFQRLFDDPDLRPDELKIYPCSLVESADLMELWRSGRWRPYRRGELLSVLTRVLPATPPWCRLNRVIRDIPGGDIVTGNTTTNLREVAEAELARRGVALREIRSREVRGETVSTESLRVEPLAYEAGVSREIFLQAVSRGGVLAGFCRLSLPGGPGTIPEIAASALLREVHVYGAVAGFGGGEEPAAAQHRGLGRRLVEEAAHRARRAGFRDLAVISAMGTRGYYRRLGFADGELYQHRALV